jgi:hypothetical protein
MASALRRAYFSGSVFLKEDDIDDDIDDEIRTGVINPATVVNAFALTLSPSPRAGEGLPIRLPFSRSGRRGRGMRANL